MLAWDFRSWEVFRPPWRNCQAANAGLGRDGRVASHRRPVPHRPGGAAAFAVDGDRPELVKLAGNEGDGGGDDDGGGAGPGQATLGGEV